MAKAYMFSFDLHSVKSTDVYTQIEDDIKVQFPDSEKILNTTYVIVTSQAGLFDKLKAIFAKHIANENHYEFYFAQMAAKGLGWLTKTKWDSLNRILNKVAVYC